VTTGTYYENINFKGKDIILCSTNPEDQNIVKNTIINGKSKGSVVIFAGTETTSCVLSGFTITHGNAEYNGGGIKGNGTFALIQNNRITDNTADEYGGGLASCNGTIQNNLITGNISFDSNGGGIASCDGTIQNNTIAGNTAYFNGGGLGGCRGTIQNNIITGNIASQGGGGGISSCGYTIQNNIIEHNTATWGGGLYSCWGNIQNNMIADNTAYYGGGFFRYAGGDMLNNTILNNRATSLGGGLYQCKINIMNCIIWGNSAAVGGDQLYDSSTPTYSCIQDWSGGGTGNISSDPKLLVPEYGDFHLMTDSPCIDAGGLISELTSDFEGDTRGYDGTSEPRGDGSDYDIGADEYNGTVPISKGVLIYYLLGRLSEIDGDYNGDKIIDAADLIRLIKNGQ